MCAIKALYHVEGGGLQPLVPIKTLGTTLGAHLMEIQCFEHDEQECSAVEICNGLIFAFYWLHVQCLPLHVYIVTYLLYLVVLLSFIYTLSTLFVAPEVLGPEKYDTSCDMWSIGVITYIL